MSMNVFNDIKFSTLILKYKKTSIVFAMLIVFLASFFLVYSDINVMLANNRGNIFFSKGDFENAEKEYAKADKFDSALVVFPEINISALRYKNGDFQKSYKTIYKAMNESCINSTGNASTSATEIKKSGACAILAYDMGNILYRLGEKIASSTNATSSEIKKQRDKLWMQAISAYQQDLAINSDDAEAKENIDFILQKLNATSTQNKSDKNNDKKNSNESSDGKNEGKSGDENKKNNNESNNSNNNEPKSNSDDGKKESESSTGETDKKDNTGVRLSESDSAKIDSYMKRLEQQNHTNQKYFNQNPNSEQQTSNNPFNDPFFDDFFKGTPFENQFSNGGQESVDNDW